LGEEAELSMMESPPYHAAGAALRAHFFGAAGAPLGAAGAAGGAGTAGTPDGTSGTAGIAAGTPDGTAGASGMLAGTPPPQPMAKRTTASDETTRVGFFMSAVFRTVSRLTPIRDFL
jgi:hypothetical protein